jgi:hypothetical protein
MRTLHFVFLEVGSAVGPNSAAYSVAFAAADCAFALSAVRLGILAGS